MKMETRLAEVGVIMRRDGSYELALYRRTGSRRIRFKVDASLAWAVMGAINAPITAEEELDAPQAPPHEPPATDAGEA